MNVHQMDFYWVRVGGEWRPAFCIGEPNRLDNWETLGRTTFDVDEVGPKIVPPKSTSYSASGTVPRND